MAAVLIGGPILSHAHYQGPSFFSRSAAFQNFITQVGASGILEIASEGQTPRQVTLRDAAALQAFYEGYNYKPAFAGNAALIAPVLEDSWTHGLNPAHYNVDLIRSLMPMAQRHGPAQTQLELLLADAIVRYGYDMTSMRVDPAAIRQKADYWRDPVDPVALLNAAAGNRPAKALSDLAPQGPLYKALREELIKLTVARGTDKAAHVPLTFQGYTIFTPGQSHKDVAALREMLGAPYNPALGPKTYYDNALAKAVRTFQETHGLKADARIGPQTLAVLNRTDEDKIAQILVNLERLRWMDKEQPERYIIVNVPSQMLWAIENEKVAHEMRVIVGHPTRATRIFKTEITGVRFNPNWTVPMGIKRADMLPKLRENPYSLRDEKNITLYNGYGRDAPVIDPGLVDWNTVTNRDLARVRMVQPPGPYNALGAIRVLMPNEYDIYLHDTNQPDLFAHDDRALSSGCIRMAEPRKIAQFILAGNENWSDKRMQTLLDRGRIADVRADVKMPVYIVYQTIWLGPDGQLVYGADIYRHDKRLMDSLTAVNGVLAAQKAGDKKEASAHDGDDLAAL